MSAQEMRALFKRIGIEDRIATGQVYEVVRKSIPADASYRQPPGTLSEIVAYWDLSTRTEVALVHRFVRPDGSLGASGRPDPKRIEHEGVLYVLARGGSARH